jgi:hypothetical protein
MSALGGKLTLRVHAKQSEYGAAGQTYKHTPKANADGGENRRPVVAPTKVKRGPQERRA